jgi:hypothetical protein
MGWQSKVFVVSVAMDRKRIARLENLWAHLTLVAAWKVDVLNVI